MRVLARFTCTCFFVCVAAISCSQDNENATPKNSTAQPLVVYSSLPEEVVRAVTEAYTATSGVPINYMLDSGQTLIEKLVAKEHRPGADLLLIPDTGRLTMAVDSDVLRPTHSAKLQRSVPEKFRDPDHYWYGLSAQAVTVVYDKRTVEPSNLAGYAALGDEIWAGQLCLLSSKRPSSRTLVAHLIDELGEREAEVVVRRWRMNAVVPVFPTGRSLIAAIEEGRCQIAFVGSDDVARSIIEGDAPHVAHHWPSINQGGAQLNLIGAGVTRHAGNPENAVRFLEWLAAEPGQQVLNQNSLGYPSNQAVKPTPDLDDLSGFDASAVDPARLGYLHQDASDLLERARYR
jgi:iron(III) transport system substrate-binding protein